MTIFFIAFNRPEGGKFMTQVSEIGCLSTFTTNDAAEGQEPVLVTHDDQTLMFIKCLGSNVVVAHSLQEVAKMMTDA
jgi:hypothetical protein